MEQMEEIMHATSSASGQFGQGLDGGQMDGPMMFFGSPMGTNIFSVWFLLCFLTWILVIAALIALIRWLWKKGN